MIGGAKCCLDVKIVSVVMSSRWILCKTPRVKVVLIYNYSTIWELKSLDCHWLFLLSPLVK